MKEFRSLIIGYTGQKMNPAIRSGWKFTQESHQEKIKEFEKFVKDYKAKENLTAHRVNQFLRGHNFCYTDFLMTCAYQSSEAVKEVLDYFKLNIHFACEYLDSIDPNFTVYNKAQEN